MLRGNYAAKIDDKGRLKIPNAFRALIEDKHGSGLFVTSLTGEYVRIYPMPVWVALEEKLAKAARAGMQCTELVSEHLSWSDAEVARNKTIAIGL